MAADNINKTLDQGAETIMYKSKSIAIVAVLLAFSWNCATARFAQQQIVEDIFKGNTSKYEKAVDEDSVEILRPCNGGRRCENYEDSNIPKGTYDSKTISGAKLKHILESGKLCFKEIEKRNKYFLESDAKSIHLKSDRIKTGWSENQEVLARFEQRINYVCNCQNEERGVQRVTQCEIPIYSPLNDAERNHIVRLLEEKYRQENAEAKTKANTESETEWKRTEPERKRARALAERVLKKEMQDLRPATCRTDKPVILEAIDVGTATKCIADQNEMTVGEEYFHNVRLSCVQKGSKFETIEWLGGFKASKSGKRGSFRKGVNLCEK